MFPLEGVIENEAVGSESFLLVEVEFSLHDTQNIINILVTICLVMQVMSSGNS